MSGNTFGKNFRVTTFGESHGAALGCVIDGCPAGLKITTEIIQKALKGINVAVAALLTSTIINFMKKTIKKFTNAIFMMISFLLVFVFKLPSFWIILFALLIGVVLTYKEKKKVAAVEEDSKKIDGEGK